MKTPASFQLMGGGARAAAIAPIAMVALLLTTPTRATTCTVTSPADSGTGTLRAAIANSTCDTINFNLTSAITLTSGELFIGRNLTISGPGPNLLTVQRDSSAPQFRIFEIGGRVTVAISGLTIANGKGEDYGGGILIDGAATVTVSNCTISNNYADWGGGISNGTLFSEAGT